MSEMMTVDQKLGLDKFEVDEGNPHITLNEAVCQACTTKPCVAACPAGLYKLDDQGKLMFDFAGCLECGTCRVVCPAGSVSWNHPRPTFGVFYRYG